MQKNLSCLLLTLVIVVVNAQTSNNNTNQSQNSLRPPLNELDYGSARWLDKTAVMTCVAGACLYRAKPEHVSGL